MECLSGVLWKHASLIVETGQAYYGNLPGLLWKHVMLIMETGQAYYGNRPDFL